MSKEHTNDDGYADLLEEISSMYEDTLDLSKEERNRRMTAVFWKIGDRIVTLDNSTAYGTGAVERLSNDLTKKYGAGFGKRNLWYMRKFREEYDILHICAELSWSHYKVLLTVKDGARRTMLEERAVREGLSNPKLSKLVRMENWMAIVDDMEDPGATLRTRPGQLHLYKVARTTDGLLLDLGFDVFRRVDFKGLKSPAQPGDLLTCTKGARGYRFAGSNAHSTERYCYEAYVHRIVDGDTLWANVDLGFDTWRLQKFRLRGIDCAERGTEAGEKAMRYVTRKLKPGFKVRLHTYALDPFARYEVDVYYTARPVSANAMASETMLFLNRELVEKGVARPMGKG